MSDQVPQIAYVSRLYSFSVFMKNSDGTPAPVSGDWSFTLRLKNGDGSNVISGTTGDGHVTIADGPGGQIDVEFSDVEMGPLVFAVPGLHVAELLNTTSGINVKGRWNVYVGEEDEVPQVTNNMTIMGSQNLVITSYDSLILGALTNENDLVSPTFFFDAGNSPVAAGKFEWYRVPFQGVLVGYMLTANVPTTCVLDVWKTVSSLFPPTIADTITASDKPSLANDIESIDNDISTWEVAVAKNDIIMAYVESNDVATKLNLSLTLRRT